MQEKDIARQKELESNFNLSKMFEEKIPLISNDVLSGEQVKNPLDLRMALLYMFAAAKQEIPKEKTSVNPIEFGRLSAIRDQDLSTELKKINVPNISEFVFSPDGGILATASGRDSDALELWSVKTGEHLKTLQKMNTSWIGKVAYNPNGKIIAVALDTYIADDLAIQLWDIETGKPIKKMKGHTETINSIAYSPDGKLLASASNDRSIFLWDPESGEKLKIFKGHKDSVDSVAFSSDGKRIVSGSADNTLKVWDVETGKILKTLEDNMGEVKSVSFGSSSNAIVTISLDHGDKIIVRLWNLSVSDSPRILSGLGYNARDVVALSPNMDILAVGSSDDIVRLWNINTGKLVRVLQGHSANIRCRDPSDHRLSF